MSWLTSYRISKCLKNGSLPVKPGDPNNPRAPKTVAERFDDFCANAPRFEFRKLEHPNNKRIIEAYKGTRDWVNKCTRKLSNPPLTLTRTMVPVKGSKPLKYEDYRTTVILGKGEGHCVFYKKPDGIDVRFSCYMFDTPMYGSYKSFMEFRQDYEMMRWLEKLSGKVLTKRTADFLAKQAEAKRMQALKDEARKQAQEAFKVREDRLYEKILKNLIKNSEENKVK